jgi:drug/metabolite transporter (DMT)-like permease
MSDPRNVPLPPQPPANGCLTAFLILVGIVLLLPGLCAIILLGIDMHEVLHDAGLTLLILFLLAVGAGGIALIWWAIQRPR